MGRSQGGHFQELWINHYSTLPSTQDDGGFPITGYKIDMLDIQYEDMVSDPETQSKKVCEYLGVTWTQDILNFHKSSRTVRTASRDQVRKPIYKSSVKKYEQFGTHLDPLRKGLGIDQD